MQGYCDNIVFEYKYGGFWARFAAYLIDKFILFFGLLTVRLILWILSFSIGDIFSNPVLFTYSFKDIILYICRSMYFVLITYYTGTTIGKKIFNLKVISIRKKRKKPTFIDILYRETIGRFLCKILLIGYIFVAFDKEKRGFHDMLCDTRVVEVYRKKIVPVSSAEENL